MRSLSPSTLFGRLFLATIAVIAATLVVILLLVLRERRDVAFTQSGAAAFAASIVATSEQLAGLPPEQRDRELVRLRQERIEVAGGDQRPRPPPPRDSQAAQRIFSQEIQKRLGDAYRVSTGPTQRSMGEVIQLDASHGDGPPGPPPFDGAQGPPPREIDGRPPPHRPGSPPPPRTMDVSVLLPDGQQIVFRAPTPRTGPPLPRQLFIELGVLTLVLGVVLYAMTRTITQPLADLAAAADAAGRGAAQTPLPERGARELRHATRAFNAMQERLKRYLDSRTRVAAAMSHDLRTPLTRLRLRVESIEDDALRERCQSDLDEMANMVTHSLSMFRSLNDDEAPSAIDVNALLAELQRNFSETDGQIAIVGAAATSFTGRALALKRCLSNLIGNALRYGGDATVSVEDGVNLVIRILDRGPGIPAASLEQVFEPFFRLEASRNRETGGAGLGLSIARDIAQAHGGVLTLSNRAEGGLEAKLVLPRGS